MTLVPFSLDSFRLSQYLVDIICDGHLSGTHTKYVHFVDLQFLSVAHLLLHNSSHPFQPLMERDPHRTTIDKILYEYWTILFHLQATLLNTSTLVNLIGAQFIVFCAQFV